MSQGTYFNIDSDQKVPQISTPYDQQIIIENDSLNKTYVGYGSLGRQRFGKQAEEDNNAKLQGVAVMSERAAAKSNSNYKNASWDLVDGFDLGNVKLDSIREQDLPKELQGKTKEQQIQYIEDKKADRIKYQNNISDLSKKREAYIEAELKKMSESGTQKDFGSAIIESLVTTAQKNGFTIE
ncbi:hypothetical protein D3C80_1558110 [compost metagenome]